MNTMNRVHRIAWTDTTTGDVVAMGVSPDLDLARREARVARDRVLVERVRTGQPLRLSAIRRDEERYDVD